MIDNKWIAVKLTERRVRKNCKFWKEFMSMSHRRRTNKEWKRASRLASDWDTCACGSINDGLPRKEENNVPLDHRLSNLGCLFATVIQDKNLARARRIFNQIQIRAGLVLSKKYTLTTWE